ncbi:MAG: hypothetical protein QHI48_06080 [Bacteroidota bacterium]|nr:hypothetical protein [Bacteroidota bacterium]
MSILDMKCAFDDELIRVPLDKMQVRKGKDDYSVVFSTGGSLPVFTGVIPGPKGVAGWVLAFLTSFLGGEFDPAISVGEARARFEQLSGAVLGVTAGREGFHLLVTPERRVHGVIGPKYTRVNKRWVHGLAVTSLAAVWGGPVAAQEEYEEYGRAVLTYCANGMNVMKITYGEETGCSAYEVMSITSYRETPDTESHTTGVGCGPYWHWRHNQSLGELEAAVVMAVRQAALGNEIPVDPSTDARLRRVVGELRAAWRLGEGGCGRPARILGEVCHA